MKRKIIAVTMAVCMTLGCAGLVFADDQPVIQTENEELTVQAKSIEEDSPDTEPVEDSDQASVPEAEDSSEDARLLDGDEIAVEEVTPAEADEIEQDAAEEEANSEQLLGSSYINYTLGSSYVGGMPDNETYYKFAINEKSHVYAYLMATGSNREYLHINYWDLSGNKITETGSSRKSSNSAGSEYYYKHSFDLEAGTYYLKIYCNHSERPLLDLLITAEPVVALDRPSITALSSPSAGQLKVTSSNVTDALIYQVEYSKNPDFTDGTVIDSPIPTCTASGLTKGAYYFVRVRPYTVYNDGIKVYGNWSRARSVLVKKIKNAVTISTGSKTVKYSKLKSVNQSFQILADDKANATLIYALSSVPAKAKSYVSINKSTGKVTVKKKLAKGTYKLGVKVTAKATSNYYSASAIKTITLKIS